MDRRRSRARRSLVVFDDGFGARNASPELGNIGAGNERLAAGAAQDHQHGDISSSVKFGYDFRDRAFHMSTETALCRAGLLNLHPADRARLLAIIRSVLGFISLLIKFVFIASSEATKRSTLLIAGQIASLCSQCRSKQSSARETRRSPCRYSRIPSGFPRYARPSPGVARAIPAGRASAASPAG